MGLVGEGDDGGPVPRPYDPSEELARRAARFAQLVEHRSRGVEQDAHVDGPIEHPLETPQALRQAIFRDGEVVTRQAVDRLATSIEDRREELDERDVELFHVDPRVDRDEVLGGAAVGERRRGADIGLLAGGDLQVDDIGSLRRRARQLLAEEEVHALERLSDRQRGLGASLCRPLVALTLNGRDEAHGETMGTAVDTEPIAGQLPPGSIVGDGDDLVRARRVAEVELHAVRRPPFRQGEAAVEHELHPVDPRSLDDGATRKGPTWSPSSGSRRRTECPPGADLRLDESGERQNHERGACRAGPAPRRDGGVPGADDGSGARHRTPSG